MIKKVIIKKHIEKQKTKQKYVYKDGIEIDEDMQICIVVKQENSKILDVEISLFGKQKFKTQTQKNKWIVLNFESKDSKSLVKIKLK